MALASTPFSGSKGDPTGERTRYDDGTFSWVDLGTTDLQGAKSFYTELFGWEVRDAPAGAAGTYSMFFKKGKSVAGCYEQYPEQRAQGVPPNWLSYVTVDDVDDFTSKAEKLGGTILQTPFDVVDAGRMALLADPQGAVFAMWQGRGHIGAELVNEPGTLCWNELRTEDIGAARGFYEDLFRWRFEELQTPVGPYLIAKLDDRSNGSIMGIPPGMPADTPPHWAAYFAVGNCDDAVAKVRDLGGQVYLEPMDVPMGRIAAVADPQGGVFCFFAGKLDP